MARGEHLRRAEKGDDLKRLMQAGRSRHPQSSCCASSMIGFLRQGRFDLTDPVRNGWRRQRS
jgi:hypothetical protein